MRPVVLLAWIASGCATPTLRADLDAAPLNVGEAAIEVVNGTGRELPAPRPGPADEIARVAGWPSAGSFSTADVFAAEVASALREKGVERVERRDGAPVFRVTLNDFDLRNVDTTAAVAFVSVSYALLDPDGRPLWQAAENRLPIRLGGPDLTRSELARIVAEAARRALASFPSPQ